MSSTNKTPNYALPQFIPTDKPTWLGDVNAAMLAIDAAMAENHTMAEGSNTTAESAMAQVQAAKDLANEAKTDSAAALTTATNAVGVAQNALTAATTAGTKADNATSTAQTAAASAATATGVANAANNTANETKAELTEFEHLFSVDIFNQIDNNVAKIHISPALFVLAITAPQGPITETEQTLWKCNGTLFGGVTSEVNIEVGDNIYLIAHPPENNTQSVGIRSVSGSITLTGVKTFFFYSTTEVTKAIINANKPTRLSINKTPQERFIGSF